MPQEYICYMVRKRLLSFLETSAGVIRARSVATYPVNHSAWRDKKVPSSYSPNRAPGSPSQEAWGLAFSGFYMLKWMKAQNLETFQGQKSCLTPGEILFLCQRPGVKIQAHFKSAEDSCILLLRKQRQVLSCPPCLWRVWLLV